jgi:uncharacterized protein YwbE
MAKTQMDKDVDAIFSSDIRTGKLALVTMAQLVTDLASTRNSDPLRRFISKARNHHHNNFSVVMTKLIRVYFGDKMVVATKDDTHPTGTNVKLKFTGNPAPNNGWGFVTAAIEKGQAYNDKAFLKIINEHLAPDDKVLAYEAQVVAVEKRAANIVKFLSTEACDVSIERAIAALRQAWKDEHPTGIVSNVVDIDDDVEVLIEAVVAA